MKVGGNAGLQQFPRFRAVGWNSEVMWTRKEGVDMPII
jgi:hypothetical protein